MTGEIDARFRDMFARQGFGMLAGTQLESCADGQAVVTLIPRPEVLQARGFVHGGCLCLMHDLAAGMASFSLTQPGEHLLSSTINMHFLRPGVGERIIARGSVIRHGARLSLSESRIVAIRDGEEFLVATGTMSCAIGSDSANP